MIEETGNLHFSLTVSGLFVFNFCLLKIELTDCYSLYLDLGDSPKHKRDMLKYNQLKYPELEH